MASFRTFIEQQEFVEFAQQSFQNTSHSQKWSATKDEIMGMWRNLRADTPIYLKPIQKVSNSDNKSYNQDGIRVTGSYQFIASVLSRLKELLGHENPHTKLRLVFRNVEKQGMEEPSYVFYLNSEVRGKGKKGRPKKGII